MKGTDGVAGGRLDRIGNPEEAGDATLDDDEDHGLARRPQRFGALGQRAVRDAQLMEQRGVADADVGPVEAAYDALPRDRSERRDVAGQRVSRAGLRYDGVGQRVLAGSLQARRRAEHGPLVESGRGDDGHDARLAFRERARLVDHQRVDALERLERLRILEEHTHRGGTPDPDHDRHRRRQAEGARTRDDEDGDGVDEGVREARLGAGEGPHEESEPSGRDDARHEVAGDLVGELLDRGTTALRLCDEADNLSEEGVATDPFGFHHEAAVAVQRPADDARSRGLLDRDGFTGDHRFVDRTRTFENDAVARHSLAGPDAEGVARVDSDRAVRPPPSHRRVRAGQTWGARCRRARIALPVCPRARSSRTWPTRTRTVITAAASKYTPTAPSIPRSEGGKIDGAMVATTLKAYAAPAPSAINVNMLKLRRTIDATPRSKKGQPAQRTTGVARTSWIHWRARIESRWASGCPGIASDMPSSTTMAVGAIDPQSRRLMSMSSGFGAASSVTVRGSSAMPQIGHAPGASRTTSRCMGQTYSTLPADCGTGGDAGARAGGVAGVGAGFRYRSGVSRNRVRHRSLQKK